MAVSPPLPLITSAAARRHRGLIAHHFGGKDGLLAAVYHAGYAPLLADLSPDPPLPARLDRLFSLAHFTRATLNFRLALWTEVAVNADLQIEHRRNYGAFHATVARANVRHAPTVAPQTDDLATALIGLADGL